MKSAAYSQAMLRLHLLGDVPQQRKAKTLYILLMRTDGGLQIEIEADGYQRQAIPRTAEHWRFDERHASNVKAIDFAAPRALPEAGITVTHFGISYSSIGPADLIGELSEPRALIVGVPFGFDPGVLILHEH